MGGKRGNELSQQRREDYEASMNSSSSPSSLGGGGPQKKASLQTMKGRKIVSASKSRKWKEAAAGRTPKKNPFLFSSAQKSTDTNTNTSSKSPGSSPAVPASLFGSKPATTTTPDTTTTTPFKNPFGAVSLTATTPAPFSFKSNPASTSKNTSTSSSTATPTALAATPAPFSFKPNAATTNKSASTSSSATTKTYSEMHRRVAWQMKVTETYMKEIIKDPYNDMTCIMDQRLEECMPRLRSKEMRKFDCKDFVPPAETTGASSSSSSSLLSSSTATSASTPASSLFSSSTNQKDSSKSGDDKTKATPKFTGFSFGDGGSSTSSTTTSTTPKPFSFGTSSPKPFSFGAPSSGDSAKKPTTTATTTTTSAPPASWVSSELGKKPGSTFGASAATTGTAAPAAKAAPAEEGSFPKEAKAEVQKENNSKEDTLYEIRAKQYKYAVTNPDTKAKGWKEFGTGVVRLYRDKKDTSKHRLVMRNDVGRVQLNCGIHKGMDFVKKSHKKFASVSFAAVQDEKTGFEKLMLRVKPDQLDEFHEKLKALTG